jgi:dihydroxyacetone kinase DhaKLM complex PTS-EIIA-like component DhaM
MYSARLSYADSRWVSPSAYYTEDAPIVECAFSAVVTAGCGASLKEVISAAEETRMHYKLVR